VVFRLYKPQRDSILPVSNLPIFKGTYTDPGGIVYYDGQFHMFYNNLQDFPPTAIAIGYATSPDGQNWTRVSDTSILDARDVSYAENVVRAASVLVEDDGTWVLYFDTLAAEPSQFPYSVIGRATADSPAGPWKADPAPALVPDPEGWDRYAIQRPCVVQTEDGYLMYYQAYSDRSSAPTVALATSSDGIDWIKHETPVFQGSDVTWGKYISIYYPYVVENDEGWLLFFKATGDQFQESIGMAASTDGIHWQLAQDQPVFQTSQYKNWLTVFVIKVLNVDQTWYLFLEFENQTGSKVNVALFEGALIPGRNIAPLASEP
jgi:sucrose-6-phosphate hydrolase SacC (GH32 family)